MLAILMIALETVSLTTDSKAGPDVRVLPMFVKDNGKWRPASIARVPAAEERRYRCQR
jgi:hypothetical protein